jgi:flagellar protein FliL
MKGCSEKTTEVTEEEVATAEGEEKPTESKKKDKGKKEAHKGPAIYVGMEPPFVANFGPTQASRFLQVTVQLLTRDQATSQVLRDNDPMLRNDLLALFGNQNSETLTTPEGKEALRKQALDTVRAVVKAEGGDPDLVENIFFTTFVMQ